MAIAKAPWAPGTPTYTSSRGTSINTSGLTDDDFKRVSGLANSGYGAKASQVADTLRKRAAATAPPATTPPAGTPPTGGTTGGVPQTTTPPAAGTGTTTPPANGAPASGAAGSSSNFFTSSRGTKIDVSGLSGGDLKRVQDLANSGYGTKAMQVAKTLQSRTPSTTTPPPPADTGTGTAPPPDSTSQVGDPPPGSSGTPDPTSFFPSMSAFEPQNYQGSPLYQWQQQQGTDALNKVLSKRGLLNSGAEIQANSDFQTALGAGEADKARGYAENDADRYERLADNASSVEQRSSEDASDDLFRWTQLGLQQNPANASFTGTGNYAGAVGNTANSLASFLASNYAHVSGGGGGGSSASSITPPFPSGPDYSNINTVNSVASGQNSNSMWNAITSALPSLFK